ncbi:MAG: zf-HC2 domain-containing protein [Gemmatimonadota bacterium]
MPHLDDGMIHALLDGEIPSSELPPITTHLASCAECRARLERAQALMAEADELIEVLDLPAEVEVPATIVTPIRRPQRWIAPVAWAASLVIAVGGGYAARGNLILVPPQESVAVNAPTQAADKTVAPPPAVATREATPPAAAPARTEQPAAKSSAAPPVEQRAALAEATKPNDAARERREPAPPAAAPAPLAAGAAMGALRDAASGNVARRADEARELAPRNAATPKQLALDVRTRVDTIELPDAMRLLGGNIRLVGGLVPRRLESAGNEVRVVYPLASGELVLAQWLASGRIAWRLAAPAGFPADSVEKLRRMVRE